MIKTPNQIGLARVEGELPRVSLDIESSGGMSLDIEKLLRGKLFGVSLDGVSSSDIETLSEAKIFYR